MKSPKDETLISVRGVSKKFCKTLRNSLWYGAKDIANELLVSRTSSNDFLRPDEFWALRDVSFELKRGESLAIVGANGAGKSTLLKLLYGMIRPDTGELRIFGGLGAIIELGAGIDPVLTGRENIYTRAALLNSPKKQVEPMMNLIIDFAGLQDFIDTPVQFYSSGMAARLAYAATAFVKSDILLIDEILAVGDIDFQRKCVNHILRYLEEGGSIVLVSHNPNHIHSICRRGILLENGRLTFSGTAIETLDTYFQKQYLRPPTDGNDRKEAPLSDERPVAIESARLESIDGGTIENESNVDLTVSYRSMKTIENVIWGFSVWTSDNLTCVTASYNLEPKTLKKGTGFLQCVIPKLPLTAGTYLLKVAIAEESSLQPLALHGWRDLPVQFVVHSRTNLIKNVQSILKQLVTMKVEWK